LGKLGDFLGFKSKEQESLRIFDGKDIGFEDIELVDIKFSNLKDPEDLSNVIHIGNVSRSKEKNIEDYYTSFSDFEIWNSLDKQEYILASTLAGALFIIQGGKQVLVYCFDFGINSLRTLMTYNQTRLLIENDIGDFLLLLLEKRRNETVCYIFYVFKG
jgi:hypothetical protein